MNVLRVSALCIIALFITGSAVVADAKDDVGSVIALRGRALIERDQKPNEAKVKDPVIFKDTVVTLESSKAKMLFIDDSVLSMGENSKVVIREFLYTKDKGGRSIFNLIDGRMKSVVGKTNVEVHTPTAVAAARGTVILFEAGMKDGKKFTTIICTEGEIIITSPDPAIRGRITLTAGMMITIVEGEPFPIPWLAPGSEIERLGFAIEIRGYDEISIPGPTEAGAGWFALDIPYSPPIINQPPPSKPTPVTIDLIFK